MSNIRLLIVDDSPFIRKALLRILESDPSIEVVGAARNGKEALEKLISLEPDVITLDIMMPGMDGIETLKGIMEIRPTPVLMLSQYTHEGAELTLNALELGAIDFVDKSTSGLMDFFELAHEIISKIKAVAGKKPLKITTQAVSLQSCKGSGLISVIAIGASTGGPIALQMLLSKFPSDINFGILIVQHMPHGFTGPLAKRLDSLCSIRIKEAEEGDKIENGTAFIAPSGLHMKIRKGTNRIRLDVEPLNALHRPSIDVLFQSTAENYNDRAAAAILTGMGSDGAKGMKTIKEHGGITFAQDETTSTIFGMPKVAIESGVVDKITPITLMAEEILRAI